MKLVKLSNKVALGLAYLTYKADTLTQKFARAEIACKENQIIRAEAAIEAKLAEIQELEQYT